MRMHASLSAAEIEESFDKGYDSFVTLTPSEVGSRLSPFGNSFYTIDDGDIEA